MKKICVGVGASVLLGILVILFGFMGCEKTVYKEDDTPPEITTGPDITTTDNTATVVWVTDEPTNGTVRYGEYPGVYDSTVADLDEYRLNHSFTVYNLKSYTTYYFIVESVDFFGNGPAASEEQSFTTEHNECSYTALGWAEFEGTNYDSAIAKFEMAEEINSDYADALTGLGWCYTRLDILGEASDYFTDAIDLDALAVDAYAGRAGVNLKLGDVSPAIDDARMTLEIDSLYVFSHDTTITYLDLHLLLAECYYQTQQYGLAHQKVEYLANVFNLTFNLDEYDNTTWTDPAGNTYGSYLEALLAWIQYLKDFV